MKDFGKWVSLLALSVSVLPGCRVHQVGAPPSQATQLANAFQRHGGEGAQPDEWWKQYADSRLDRLIEDALSGNLQLSQAWSRLKQAEAIAGQTAAGLMPTVGADVSAARSRSPGLFGQSQERSQFGAGVSVGYEVDIWGRIRDLKDAAKLDVAATRLEVDALAMTLVSQVAEAYFDVIEQRQQRALLQKQIQVGEEYLSLVQFRFNQGEAAALDIFQQKQSVAGLKARIPQVDTGAELAEHRLAVLLGKAPGSLSALQAPTLPGLPSLPATGVPASLLERRPDLKAAELRTLAADHRVGAAIAGRLPNLRIGAEVGLQAPEIQDIVSDFVWSIFASLSGTLWDGGRLDAEIDRSKAAFEERIQGFRQALLGCIQEVEDSLTRNHHHSAYLERLMEQEQLAESTLQEARNRYVNGLNSYLPVLQALQGLQEIQRGRLAAHRQGLTNRNLLFKSLGGSWTNALSSPTAPETSKEDQSP